MFGFSTNNVYGVPGSATAAPQAVVPLALVVTEGCRPLVDSLAVISTRNSTLL